MTDKELWEKIKNNVTEDDLHELLDRYDKGDICRGYTVSMLLDVIKNE